MLMDRIKDNGGTIFRLTAIGIGVLAISYLGSKEPGILGFERATFLVTTWTLTSVIGLRWGLPNTHSAYRDRDDLQRLGLNGMRRKVLTASILTQVTIVGNLVLNLVAGMVTMFTPRTPATLFVTLTCLVTGNVWLAATSEMLARYRHGLMERVYAGEEPTVTHPPDKLIADTGDVYELKGGNS